MTPPERREKEQLWDYIARAMTDTEFKAAVPDHDERFVLVVKASTQRK